MTPDPEQFAAELIEQWGNHKLLMWVEHEGGTTPPRPTTVREYIEAAPVETIRNVNIAQMLALIAMHHDNGALTEVIYCFDSHGIKAHLQLAPDHD